MNWRDTKMRGPRPSVGRVNRDHGSGGPGAFGYGRSGTLNEGQNHHNSYRKNDLCVSTPLESEGKEKKDNEPSPEVPQATTEHPKGTCRLRDLFIEKIWFIYFAVLIVAMAYRFWQLEPMLPPEPILLRAGAKLYPGQWRSSATHHIRLGVDGNLLLSEGLYGAGGRVVWQSKTGQEGGKCRRCFARLKKGSRKENPAISKLEVWNGPKVLATFPLVDTFPLDMHIHQV